MALDLPPPIAAYYAAKNRQDTDAMLAPFAPDAIVRDEDKDYASHDDIRAWMEASTRKYGVTVAPQTMQEAGGHLVVAALVSGNFPGSPATLHYTFTLIGSMIARLEIA